MAVDLVWIQTGGETAEQARRLIDSVFGGRSGILGADDLEVTESATAAMTVDVAAGQVLIPGTEETLQGTYWVHSTVATTGLAIAAADPTNARIDLVVMQVLDSAYSGTDDKAEISVVTGTAAATPEDPTVPENAWVLAKVAVAAGATSITNADITDQRTQRSGQELPTGGAMVLWDALDTVPSAATDTGSNTSAYDTWITIGSLTVPFWATGCRYTYTISGAFGNFSTATISIRLSGGGVTGNAHSIETADTSSRFDLTGSGRLTGLTAGTASFLIEDKRVSGTGSLRVDASSHVSVLVDWEP